MTFSFHPLAKKELDGSVNYYEKRHKGLGFDFAQKVYKTIQNIISFPYA